MKKLRVILIILIIILVVLIIFESGIISAWNQEKQGQNENETFNQEETMTEENILQMNTINEIINENTNTIKDDIQENEINDNFNNINEIENNKSNNIIDTPNNNSVQEDDIEEDNIDKKPNKNIKFDETVAFIGDSRTQGFIMYNGLSKVQDYSYIGLMVDTAKTKEFVKTSDGKKITLLQDMKNKNIKSVYIMLGVNELGWSYPSVFKLKYKELIEEIKKVKPNCNIYVQSIIPVTKKKDQSDKIYNNTRIKEFNELIKEVASEMNVKYLDVASVLTDEQGYLPEESSTDGIHIGRKYCAKWLDYLKENS